MDWLTITVASMVAIGGVALGLLTMFFDTPVRRWWNDQDRRPWQKVTSALLLSTVVFGAAYWPLRLALNNATATDQVVADEFVVLSVLNKNQSPVTISSWFEYRIIEVYSNRFFEGPTVPVRPIVPSTRQPLTQDISLAPGEEVPLVIIVRMDRKLKAIETRGGADVFVTAHLSNGEPIVSSIPFQEDTIRAFRLQLIVDSTATQ